jgi:hypothetical protein
MVVNIVVAPAKAGAHHAYRRKPQDEIGTSRRWCDAGVECD